jgi:N-acetylmuramic acid 6-phosphate (MurNAc-6-P) etherase
MIDLRATNAKLRDRAIRIVATALECDAESARERLHAADWSVRAALEKAAEKPAWDSPPCGIL